MEENRKETIEMLEEEIRSLLDELKVTQPTSEEYAKITANLKTQYDLLLEQEKMLKADRANKLNLLVNAGLNIGKLAVVLAFFNRQYDKGWNFEENGTICSDTFKSVRQDSKKNLFKF